MVRVDSRCRILGCGLILLASTLVCTVRLAIAAADADSLEIASKVVECNTRLLNLQLDFEMTEQRKSSGSDKWVDSQAYASGRAWFDGLRGSKGRIQLTRWVVPWPDSPAKWMEETADIGFGGQYGRYVTHSGGPQGRVAEVKSGRVLSEDPGVFSNVFLEYATGRAFASNYMALNDQQGLMEAISLAVKSDQGASLPFSRVLLEGTECVRLTLGDPRVVQLSYWFDLSRGYALRRYERVESHKGQAPSVTELDDVVAFGQGAPGIWYPAEAYHEGDDGNEPGVRRRFHYRAKSIVANDPAFDERVFIVPFPDGYRIADKVRRVEYIAGMEPRALGARLDEFVAVSRAKVDQPAQRPPATAASAPSPGQAKVPADSSGHITPERGVQIYVLMITIAVVATAVGVVLLRKRRQILPVIIFAIALGTGQSGIAQEYQNGTAGDELLEYRSNCGVNIGYFVLKWYAREPSVQSVAQYLKVGGSFERPCSFSDMCRLFDAYELHHEAYRVESKQEMIGLVAENTIVIARMKSVRNGTDIGHFIALVGIGSGILVADPPNAAVVITQQEAAGCSAISQFTGECLVVTVPIRNGPAISLETSVLDMGRIPYAQQEIIAQLTYRNIGTEPLKITDVVVGGCSCVAEVNGDRECPPGEKRVLSVRFDRRKLVVGATERPILITTNDSANPRVVAKAKMDISAAPLPDEIWASPNEIRWGRIADASRAIQERKVYVVIPTARIAQVKRIDIATSTPQLHVQEVEQDEGAAGHEWADSFARAYKVRWADKRPDGPFRESIRFTVVFAGEPHQELQIPVQGEFRGGSPTGLNK